MGEDEYKLQPKEAPFGAGSPGGTPPEGRGRSNRNWHEIARTHRIESEAQSLHIPERSWNHPTVHSFVEANLDARDIQQFMSIRQMRLDYDMEPPLSSRYTDGELLMRGVCEILKDGVGAKAAYVSDYLASKVGLVTKRFGVMVTHLPKEATQVPELHEPPALPGSAWADYQQTPRANLYQRYASVYGAENFTLWFHDAPRINNQTEEQTRVRVIATAQRLGIPEHNVSHPAVQEFIHNLQNMEDLLEIFENGEVPPGAPGLTPTVAERYKMGAHLLPVAIAIMEEGFQGRMVEPQFVADHVDSALSYFGLQARLELD